jgi:hypothetical protein
MNERIRELKQQATDYVDIIDDGLGIEHYRQLVDQKFAELIVRECARVYWNIDDSEIHGEYVKALKKHFGVSE